MKKVYNIPKSRLYGGADYAAVLSECRLGGYKLERIDLDEITIATGTVCFFDPYAVSAGRAFTERFPSGAYRPFMLTIATDRGTRVAFAGLDDGGLAACKQWRLAVADERDVLRLLLPDETVGVSIGSGFGALCDERTLARFAQLVKEGKDTFHPLDGAISMDGSCAQLCCLKDIRLPVCNTGWGEGTYACYVGKDEAGTPRGVLCDFAMIPVPGKRDNGATEAFEFDMDPAELYIPDPNKSDAENSIAQYSAVLDAGDIDAIARFNAYSRRGYSYHTAGRYEDALADYLQAIEIGRKNAAQTDFAAHAWSLYDNAALICRETGRTDDAIALYKEAKGVSDTFYGGAFAGLIDIYRESKNYTEALRAADEMIAARPQDPSAYVKRSEIYMACEEYEKAIGDLDILIGTYKLNESIFDKAMCLSYLGRNEEALRVLDGYLLEGRANEVYYDLRASLHGAAHDFTAAYFDARKAFDVNPDYPPALEKLIEMDGLLFRYKNVIKWATCYIELRPRTAYGYSVRAEAYARAGDYEESIADYQRLIRIDGKPEYYALLIKTALEKGDRGLAKKFGKLLRKKDNAYYIYSMGLMLFADKKYAGAERYFASAFALKESDAILSSLIDVLIETRNFRKAEGVLGRYAEIADEEVVFLKRARMARAQGATPQSIESEYVNRFLYDCADPGLLEKVGRYFRDFR